MSNDKTQIIQKLHDSGKIKVIIALGILAVLAIAISIVVFILIQSGILGEIQIYGAYISGFALGLIINAITLTIIIILVGIIGIAGIITLISILVAPILPVGGIMVAVPIGAGAMTLVIIILGVFSIIIAFNIFLFVFNIVFNISALSGGEWTKMADQPLLNIFGLIANILMPLPVGLGNLYVYTSKVVQDTIKKAQDSTFGAIGIF